jgi:hypothetical protein
MQIPRGGRRKNRAAKQKATAMWVALGSGRRTGAVDARVMLRKSKQRQAWGDALF